MAGELNNLFSAVNQTLQIAGSEETVRSIVSSPLATGVRPAIGTSFLPRTQTLRISSGADPSVTGVNQNDRSQTPPGAMNKVPRLYGNVTTGGVIIDAVKSNANTIFVAMVLSEMNSNYAGGGFDYYDTYPAGSEEKPFELHDVYYDNFKCTVSGNPLPSGFGKITTLNPLDGSSSIDISAANVLHTYAWAGNSDASSMIFPVDGYAGSIYARNAYDVFPGWTANANPMTDLVFAIVEVDRLNEDIDPTANIEIDEIGEWRFTLETRGLLYPRANVGDPDDARYLSNPSGAMQDYLLNKTYGVGLTEADLDRDSFNAWYSYCTENYYYVSTVNKGSYVGTGTYDGETYYVYLDGDRWKTGAFINPQVTVAENIDEIAKSGQGTLAYDNRTGKFRVLVNRPMTTAEKANAFLFNSDNIVSGIQVNSTDLYSLFNFADASFPNNLQQDQPDTVIVQTPTEDKLTNEPNSGMSFQLTAVTDRYRAAQMANNSLKASRIGNMCRFDADYSTLDVQVGDFVKITEKSKGWDEKFWRVMRATEIEGDEGEVVMQFSCLEYDEFVFEDIFYAEDRDRGFATGVSKRETFFQWNEFSFEDVYESQSPVLVQNEFDPGSSNDGWDIIIVDNPLSGNGNIFYANGVFKSSETIASLSFTIDPNDDRPVSLGQIDTDNEPWAAVATVIDVPSSNANIQINWDSVTISLIGQDGNEGTQAFTQTYDTYDHPPDAIYGWTSIALNKVSSGTYKIAVQYNQNDSVPSRSSGISYTPNVTITQYRCDGNALLNTYSTGTEITQTATMTSVHIPANTNREMHTPIQHDVCNIKQGEFTFTTNYTPTWSSIAAFDDIAFTPTGNILFVNDANIASHVVAIGGGGIDYTNIDANVAANLLNNVQTVTSTFSTDPAFHGLSSDWYPSRINVVMIGNNSATGGDFTDVSYSIINQDAFYRNQ